MTMTTMPWLSMDGDAWMWSALSAWRSAPLLSHAGTLCATYWWEVLVVAIVCCLVATLGDYLVKLWRLRHIPGPFPVPIVGNVLHPQVFPVMWRLFLNPWGPSLDRLNSLVELRRTYGDVFVVWKWHTPTILVCNPGDASEVLCHDKMWERNRVFMPEIRNFLSQHSLVGADTSAEYRRDRGAVNRFFSQSRILERIHDFSEQIEVATTEFLDGARSTVLDVEHAFGVLTLRVLEKLAFSNDLRKDPTTEAKTREFATWGEQYMTLVFAELPAQWVWAAGKRRTWELMDTCKRHLQSLVSRRRLRIDRSRARDEAAAGAGVGQQQSNAKDPPCNANSGSGAPPPVASASKVPAKGGNSNPAGSRTCGLENRLVAAVRLHRQVSGEQPDGSILVPDDALTSMITRNIPEDHMMDNAWTLFIAGHGTTTWAMSWAFYYLAKHPEYQERVRAEALDVLGPFERPTASNIVRLTFTMQCLMESLRIRPVIMHCARTPAQDVTLPTSGYTIPRGARVVVSIYGLHHHEGLWENPGEYNPDRFAGIAEMGSDPFRKMIPQGFMPFAAGGRMCIGRHLATTQVVCCMATMLRRYRVSVEDNFEALPRAGLVMGSANHMPIKFEPLPEPGPRIPSGKTLFPGPVPNEAGSK